MFDEAQVVLASPDRNLFLARLSWELVIAGRAMYVGAGTELEDSQQALHCINELQHVVTSQLVSAMRGGDAAYPASAFLQVLTEKARSHRCDASLQSAVRLAVEFVGRETG
jgi:hypothetical protein